MLCMCVLQSGHRSVLCVILSTLCRYDCNSGDLSCLSCASCLLVFLGSVCSVLLIVGAILFRTVFVTCVLMCCCTISVCMSFMFFFMVSGVVLFGFVSLLIV